MCRNLRIQSKIKQKDVAAAVGIRPSTYSNLESSQFRVVNVEKAWRLARFFGLDGEQADLFIAAHGKTELSDYAKNSRDRWQKRNTQRSKARRAEALERALIDLLAVTFSLAADDTQLCTCTFGGGSAGDPDRPCEVCSALGQLNLPAFESRDKSTAQLIELQARLDREAAARAAAKSADGQAAAP